MPAATDYLPRLHSSLLLDWDEPLLRGPLFVGEQGNARKKLTDLASTRSDDAVAWSVFRTLGRFAPEGWLPAVLGAADGYEEENVALLAIDFWQRVAPSSARLLWLLDHLESVQPAEEQARGRLKRVARQRDRWKQQVQAGDVERGDGILEPPLELDVLLTGPELVVALLCRYQRDIEVSTPWDSHRDHIARYLDALLDLTAGGRSAYFLLVTDDYVHEGPDIRPKSYEALMPRYRNDPSFVAAQLPHRRPAELARLEGRISWLTWADLVDAVLDGSAGLPPDQRQLLRRLVDFLKVRHLLYKGG